MCGGNCKSCASCNNNADGATNYDPVVVAQWIQKYLLPQGTVEDVKTAYPKVMVYLETKKLPVTESSITSNLTELNKVINDPHYLESIASEKGIDPKKFIAFVVIAIMVIVLIQKIS